MNDETLTPDIEQREAALAAREQQLALAQRRLQAQQLLHSRQLPDRLIGLLDLSSEEGLARSLDLADQLLKAAQLQPEIPSGAPATGPLPLNYSQRARLYQADRAAYHQATGEK